MKISRDPVEVSCVWQRNTFFSMLYCNRLHTPFVALFHLGVFPFLGGFGELSVGTMCTTLLQRALKVQSRSNNMAVAAMGCVSVCFMALIRHRMHYQQCFPMQMQTAHMSIDQLESPSGTWLLLPHKQNSCPILQFFPLPCSLEQKETREGGKVHWV